ncbi:MAG: hypothetical protein H7Y09_00020, partial [Chitinophagaceae bacterium]|nr:hypothetical protein [Anaerolineae bacterium]
MVLNWMLNRPAWRLYRELAASSPLLVLNPGLVGFRIYEVGGKRTRWRSVVLLINADGLTLYRNGGKTPIDFTCRPEQLRWFGRPDKYHPGTNHLMIHVQIGDSWQVLSLWAWKDDTGHIVRALKAIATPEQIKAYRRARPYIHYQVDVAYPGVQDIHGAWTLSSRVMLYITPAFLVVLAPNEGKRFIVQKSIPMEQIQGIETMLRLDRPTQEGIVRFTVGDEKLAFAMLDFQAFADRLGEAARRTLEDPIIEHGKKKKYDEE